jgi:hypothetical protein
MARAATRIAAIALVACGGEPSADDTAQLESSVASAGAGTTVAACELLTAEEIAAVMGTTPSQGAERPDVGDGACDWTRSDGRPLVGVVVSRTQDTYEEYMQNAREQGMGSSAEEMGTRIDGVGDYAIWYSTGYLNAAQRGKLLVVWIHRDPAGGKAKQEAAIELARTGLQRL